MHEKSIIIDFDNTIGYFKQIVYILNIIEKTNKIQINQSDINVILNNYQNIFRPKIIEILNLICILKNKNKIKFFIMYTCNNKEQFVNMIIHYMCNHLIKNPNIFNYIIFQKKKELKNINTLKTFTNNKINNHKLCFIDNKKYNYHDTDIYYIKCDSYKYTYTTKEIINNFPFEKFKKINSDLIDKYFYIINKKYKMNENNIPLKIYEMKSQNIINLINKFIHL